MSIIGVSLPRGAGPAVNARCAAELETALTDCTGARSGEPRRRRNPPDLAEGPTGRVLDCPIGSGCWCLVTVGRPRDRGRWLDRFGPRCRRRL